MPDDAAPRDLSAYIPGIGAESNADDGTFVNLWADPTTHRLLVEAQGSLASVDEDDVHVSGAAGTLTLAVRNDTLASLVDTDGDYAPFQVNASGALYTTGGTEYNEDDATPAVIVGKAVLMERDDALATVTPVEGDFIGLRGTAEGALWVQDFNSDAILADTANMDTNLGTIAGAVAGTEMQVDVITSALPSGAATAANQTTIIGHVDGIEALLTTIDADTSTLASTDFMLGTDFTTVFGTTDLVYLEDDATPAAISGLAIMAERDDALATITPIEGDWASLRLSAEGALWVQEFNSDAILADTANMDTNLGTIAGAVSGTEMQVDVVTSALPTGAATAANQTTIIGHVDGIEGLLTTIDTDTGAIATSLAIMDDWDNAASDGASVSGDVAHDGVDAGEPVKVGMKAVALKANPTEVAANDRTDWLAGVHGVPFVLGGHPNILSQSMQITDADGAQTDAAIITVAANVSIVVTKISVMADNANTVDVSVRIGFGTANTPAADAAQVILFHPGIAAGSGVVEGTGAGIIGIGASNEDLRVTCEDPVTGSINITVTYFTTDI